MAITCTPAVLLTAAGCLPCLEPFQQLTIQTYLLCQIRQALDPMATCNVQELLDGAQCFSCLTPQQLQVINTYLYCQIADGSSSGGTTWIYWEDANTSDDPPTDATKAVERRFRNGDSPVIWDPINLAWE